MQPLIWPHTVGLRGNLLRKATDSFVTEVTWWHIWPRTVLWEANKGQLDEKPHVFSHLLQWRRDFVDVQFSLTRRETAACLRRQKSDFLKGGVATLSCFNWRLVFLAFRTRSHRAKRTERVCVLKRHGGRGAWCLTCDLQQHKTNIKTFLFWTSAYDIFSPQLNSSPHQYSSFTQALETGMMSFFSKTIQLLSTGKRQNEPKLKVVLNCFKWNGE